MVKPSGLTSEFTRSSRGRRDLGVFAARDLPVGLWIPITGRPLGDPPSYPRSREYCFPRRQPFQAIDGDPEFHPFKGVGCFGLAVAMMLNEPSDAHTHANCMYSRDFVVTTATLKKGQQLLVDYGPSYHREYASDRTPAIRDLQAAVQRKALEVRVPPVEERREVLSALEKAVDHEIRRAPPAPEAKQRKRKPERKRQDSLSGTPTAKRCKQPIPTLAVDPSVAMAVAVGKYTWEQDTGARPLIARSRLPLTVNLYAKKQNTKRDGSLGPTLVVRVLCSVFESHSYCVVRVTLVYVCVTLCLTHRIDQRTRQTVHRTSLLGESRRLHSPGIPGCSTQETPA